MGRVPLSIPLAVLIALILIGDSCGWMRPQEPPAFSGGVFSAYVLSVREAETDGYLMVAQIDSINSSAVLPFKARLHFLNDYPEPIAGMRLRFRGRLQPLAAPPAVPDIVDFNAELRRRGVVASAAVARDSLVYLARTNSLRYFCAEANNAALIRLKRSGLDAQSIDILAAMLLGRSDSLTDETRAMFSAAGLSHLLALSGMHTGIIAMIISCALWPLYFGRHVRTRLLLTMLALFAFAAFTGFIPSVTRAVIMASVYMTGRIIGRKSPALNSLCLAAIIILVISPEELFAAGFQMSFAAVLGIILFFPVIDSVNRREHPRLYALVSFPALSLSAMILTGFVAAYHFHSYPLYFLFANLLIVPLVPLAISSGIISILFETPFLSDYLIGAIDWVAQTCAVLPGAVLGGLYPPAWLTVALVVTAALLGLALSGGKKFLACESAVLLVGLMVIAAVRPAPIYPEKELYTIVEPRSTQQILVANGECVVITDAASAADVADIQRRYALLLRDFMAKRNINKLTIKRNDD